MTNVFERFIQSYNQLIEEDKYADPRTKDFFLISNPLTVISIAAAYLYFCTRAGPRLMESRKPYDPKTVILLYNVFQIAVSFYIGLEGGIMYFKHYSWTCQPMDFADTPLNRKILHFAQTYFVLKLIDLTDTVFFVIRKKFNQITFLHLFHHTLMFIGSWIGLRYFATGQGLWFGIINSLIHVIMYTYYLIAGLGPEYKKYVWWKKHLTALQLVQFVLIFVQNAITLITGCDYPKFLNFLLMLFSSTFIYMFGKFYIKSYTKKPKKDVKRN